MTLPRRRVIVVGAGAAGSLAAIFSASTGAETTLLEATPDGGRKILVSGGGRCNILPARVDESRFVTDSSVHTLRKMLRSWRLPDQVAFFEKEVGIPLVEEKETAKLFPASQRAKDVRDGLFILARRQGVEIQAGSRVVDLVPVKGLWRVEREGRPPIEAEAVVLATGGLSIPLSGSDGTGLEILRRLGHTIRPTYPALTPLVASGSPWAVLAGVSLPVTVTADGAGRRASASGGFLFTHHGYSGPSVLDVSHVAVRSLEAGTPARIVVRWSDRTDDAWDEALRAAGGRTVSSVLRAKIPERLAGALASAAGIDPSTPLSRLTRPARRRLVESLVARELPWSDHGGYAKAEVTGGGVALEEIHPVTMESRRHPGLHVCGEALDAFGPIGGYNFLWAWSTGRAAGLGAAVTVRS